MQCMMWLGRSDCGWVVLPTDSAVGVQADSRRELRNAALFCCLLEESGSSPRLLSIHELLTYYVGQVDGLNAFHMLQIMKTCGYRDAAMLADDMMIDRLQTAICGSTVASQQIASQTLIRPADSRVMRFPSDRVSVARATIRAGRIPHVASSVRCHHIPG